MTGSTLVCLCREPLCANANFCPRCGREVRQQCPICYGERRLIANRTAGASPWCDNRGEALRACVRCGRWLTVDNAHCPDPACRGAVQPYWPESLGRSVDGAGRAENWKWPEAWDTRNPAYRPPRLDAWLSDAPVHSAFVAHGRVYVWAGTNLLAPDGEASGPLAEALPDSADGPWNCWLGHDGEPSATVNGGSRISIVGGAAILATAGSFLLAGLYPERADDVVKMDIGAPIAQVSGDGWWVGWTMQRGEPALWQASLSARWRNLQYSHITQAPANSVPRANTPLIMFGGQACWISEDGAIWQLDCRCREIRSLAQPMADTQRIWRDSGGTHVVRTSGDGVRVAIGGGPNEGSLREVPVGFGPLRDICATPGLVSVVGRNVTALEPRTGGLVGEGKYAGRWISGLLTDALPGAADGEPRLLMLTEDGGAGSLVALRPISGVGEPLWREPGVLPTNLIAAGESLYVVHDRGVVRLRESQ